jgi:hypothetical protein
MSFLANLKTAYMIRFLNLFLFAGMVVMNYLANALPLNNKTTGELADAYPNLFVPVGITFSIWGVIYLLLAVYCVVLFTRSGRSASEISVPFALTCLMNGMWIVCWHFEWLPLSLVVMIGLLITLIYINGRLKNQPPGITKAAFGIYLGWICIATIANVTALLVFYNWNGFGLSEVTWTLVMIIAGTFITAAPLHVFRNPYIGLSVIWAFTGIIIKRHGDYTSIAIMAGMCILFMTVLTVMGFLRPAGETR